MPRRRAPSIVPRKKPKQERSTRLVEAILQAAIRVLEREGAAAFTTIRVAEQAGVSVGSLYQYFPNKQSILFRLQQDEWEATAHLLDSILSDARKAAAERLRSALIAFFRTEYDERPLRRALGAAAPLFREMPQGGEHEKRGLPQLLALIAEVAPRLSARRRAQVADLYLATLGAMGEHISEIARSRAEVDVWAGTVADMFLAYLRELTTSGLRPDNRKTKVRRRDRSGVGG